MFEFLKKNKEVKPAVAAAPPPPTKWTSITEILAINNTTDKEYVLKSDSIYGLTWVYMHDARRLNIQEKLNYEGTAWNAIAHLDNFSIISITRKEFKAVAVSEK